MLTLKKFAVTDGSGPLEAEIGIVQKWCKLQRGYCTSSLCLRRHFEEQRQFVTEESA